MENINDVAGSIRDVDNKARLHPPPFHNYQPLIDAIFKPPLPPHQYFYLLMRSDQSLISRLCPCIRRILLHIEVGVILYVRRLYKIQVCPRSALDLVQSPNVQTYPH